jgi:ribosomal protein S3
MMIPEPVREIARKIGQFYLEKNNKDYEATAKEIDALRISEIRFETPDAVTIVTGRPGLLVGRRGMTIDALTKFLQIKIRIVEDRDPLWCHIIPVKEDEYDEL